MSSLTKLATFIFCRFAAASSLDQHGLSASEGFVEKRQHHIQNEDQCSFVQRGVFINQNTSKDQHMLESHISSQLGVGKSSKRRSRKRRLSVRPIEHLMVQAANWTQQYALLHEARTEKERRKTCNGWSNHDVSGMLPRAKFHHVPNLFKVPYEVRKSPIAGYGIFATERIENGTTVYGGSLEGLMATYAAIPNTSAARVSLRCVGAFFGEDIVDHMQMWVEEDHYGEGYLALFELGEDRYLNDDPFTPNLLDRESGGGAFELVALRDVLPGEEMTLSYEAGGYPEESGQEVENLMKSCCERDCSQQCTAINLSTQMGSR
mmetsp:Transcript_23906/g.43820  ORF Transcript_23906/g.43820 Transcript_23906/m.43820 type:complete len:320 (-) Transcript_23906:61-1020(-)